LSSRQLSEFKRSQPKGRRLQSFKVNTIHSFIVKFLNKLPTKNVLVPNSVPFTLIDSKLCLKWSYKRLFKLTFPTNHVFDCRDRIVDFIDKSFWQKSLALTIRSFCIQLEACSSNETGEKRQNVFDYFQPKINNIFVDVFKHGHS
jgi:hypothetical protein